MACAVNDGFLKFRYGVESHDQRLAEKAPEQVFDREIVVEYCIIFAAEYGVVNL